METPARRVISSSCIPRSPMHQLSWYDSLLSGYHISIFPCRNPSKKSSRGDRKPNLMPRISKCWLAWWVVLFHTCLSLFHSSQNSAYFIALSILLNRVPDFAWHSSRFAGRKQTPRGKIIRLVSYVRRNRGEDDLSRLLGLSHVPSLKPQLKSW